MSLFRAHSRQYLLRLLRIHRQKRVTTEVASEFGSLWNPKEEGSEVGRIWAGFERRGCGEWRDVCKYLRQRGMSFINYGDVYKGSLKLCPWTSFCYTEFPWEFSPFELCPSARDSSRPITDSTTPFSSNLLIFKDSCLVVLDVVYITLNFLTSLLWWRGNQCVLT
jgi:hypothetical protein